ncbi:hypothetical protein BOTBODRAFT_374261 [Botryobasidium botryosum FD-172 SS1]|uniref:Uncharacterized protein n=1 Tax=Botryobasidium botryosum (strain FD-172 SS1) TaxID=930990 RepID=A0A067MCY0_BOTB1|nr:hypothetical protein BOTBODRAFT_374261 [Botryobasidium botryosum FD-172 SS1]
MHTLGKRTLLFSSLLSGFLLVRAQHSTVTCDASSGGWIYNSLGQTPCLIFADMYPSCTEKSIVVPGLNESDPNASYGAPETDLECLCNTVAYDLISACAFCQHKPFLTWSQWTACCEPSTTPLVGK